MGFTKLDSGILFSSIMAEPGNVFKVWIALLAACGPDGISKVSSAALPGILHMTTEEVDSAIEILSSPDPKSRSINDDGRRIKRVDGGYYVINYEKYRELSYHEAEAARIALYRLKKTQKGEKYEHVRTCPNLSASASASDLGDRSVREGEVEPDPTWWKNYEEYKELVRVGFNNAIDDVEWISHQQKLNPQLHIQRSCRKAYENYWSREDTWKKKSTGPIKKRPRKLNMKNALADSLGWSAYKSYLTREEQL